MNIHNPGSDEYYLCMSRTDSKPMPSTCASTHTCILYYKQPHTHSYTARLTKEMNVREAEGLLIGEEGTKVRVSACVGMYVHMCMCICIDADGICM